MKLHAIIIDDEFNVLRTIELLVQRFIPDVKIVGLTTDPIEGIELINTYRPDIVFLDINMPSLNGFELLEKLDYTGFSLVFITAHQEYAIKAIKRAASDYLLKPVDVNEIIAAVEKVRKKRQDPHFVTDVKHLLQDIVGARNLRIPIPVKNSIEYVFPASIICIEGASNNCKILLANLTWLEVNRSLKEYEDLLCRDGQYFMRVHNSFIINLNHVIRYVKEDGGQVVLQGNKVIPISKNKKIEFLRAFNLENN